MKMRVGDITMDQQQGIEFSNAPEQSRNSVPRKRESPPPAEADKLDLYGIPIPRTTAQNYRRLAVVGASFAVLGLVAFSVVTAITGFTLLSVLGIKVTIGGALIAGGCQIARRKVETSQQQKRQQLRSQRGRRLLEHFEDSSQAQTLEELAAELTWSHEATADGLKYLMDRDEVVEDLDTDSGQWKYRLSAVTSSDDPRRLTLEERFDELEDTVTQPESQSTP